VESGARSPTIFPKRSTVIVPAIACAAMATSVTGSLWLGLLCGAFAGSLVGALLAVFAIAYIVDQVVLASCSTP
jgi:ABC-type uncharacterized transport system permease subunit